MKRTRTDRSPSPEPCLQTEDLQQAVAVTEQRAQPPTLSSQPVTVLARALTASDVHNATAILPAFNLTLVGRAEAAVRPARTGIAPEQEGTRIEDLPPDVTNIIAHMLGNEKDRLDWHLSCKQHYRLPDTVREIRLVAHHFMAVRQLPAASQNEVQLSPLSQEVISPEAKTLIQLNAIYHIGKTQGSNAQGVSWAQIARNMLDEISAVALGGALATYAKWIKLPCVLLRGSGDRRALPADEGLTKPCFLVAPILIQRMQQPALDQATAALRLCWLDALLHWSLRCSCADLSRVEPGALYGAGFNPLSDVAFNPALPISSIGKAIIESHDKVWPKTPQFLAALLAMGMRNYLVFNSGGMSGTRLNRSSAPLWLGSAQLDQDSAESFKHLAILQCFETFYVAAQALDDSGRATLLNTLSSDILSLQEHRRWSDHPLAQSYPHQAVCMLVCSLLMRLNHGAITTGEKTGMASINFAMQALESELWLIRKMLSGSAVRGFPSLMATMPEPDSTDPEETDTTAIGWDTVFNIIDKHAISRTPSNPLTELDKNSFEQDQDFMPAQGWEFDHEQRHLLKSIHLTTQTFRDLTQYLALLPATVDIAPLKHQLRDLADLWPHEVQRSILLNWVDQLR